MMDRGHQSLAAPDHPDYGQDAPGILRNFALVGGTSILACAVIQRLLARPHPMAARLILGLGLASGVPALAAAGLLLWGSRVGKLRGRDRLLDVIPWRGDELVLDVGCGRGLVLVGAARRLATGRAVGIDPWRRADQSGNRPEVPAANARAEGVADRVAVVTGDARRLPFATATFDVALSSFTVHHIDGAEGRGQAVREMARVVKPGGRIVLQDLFHTAEYARILRDSGVSDATVIADPVWLRIVTGQKIR